MPTRRERGHFLCYILLYVIIEVEVAVFFLDFLPSSFGVCLFASGRCFFDTGPNVNVLWMSAN